MKDASRAELFVDLGVGETLNVDLPSRLVDSEKICITLLYKSGLKARFRIEAAKPARFEKSKAEAAA
jgi:hypothetical protein